MPITCSGSVWWNLKRVHSPVFLSTTTLAPPPLMSPTQGCGRSAPPSSLPSPPMCTGWGRARKPFCVRWCRRWCRPWCLWGHCTRCLTTSSQLPHHRATRWEDTHTHTHTHTHRAYTCLTYSHDGKCGFQIFFALKTFGIHCYLFILSIINTIKIHSNTFFIHLNANNSLKVVLRQFKWNVKKIYQS